MWQSVREALAGSSENKGIALPTVNVSITEVVQPEPLVIVYDIMVVPGASPLTTPVALIVAAPILLLLHIPPIIELERVTVEPAHTVDPPIIALVTGSEFTVSIAVTVTLHPPPPATV